MIIELQRAFSPEEMGEEACGICDELFHVESVMAQVAAAADCPLDMGHACRTCIEMLGRRDHPERFPTIEEYEEALRRYPEPIWVSSEEAGDAWDEGGFHEIYEASWVWRSSAKDAAQQARQG